MGILLFAFTANFFNILAAVITGFVGPYVLWYIVNKIKKRNKKDPLTEALKLSTSISNKLDNIKETVKCDRVWLAQFHNGGHFYPTGKSIQKFSIFYENVDLNIPSIQQYFHNIPVHLFSKSLNQLWEHNYIAIKDFKDITIATYGLKPIHEETKSKSSYLFAIKTIDNKFIGFLVIDYIKRVHELNEEQINNLLVQTTAIGGTLLTHLNS